MPAAVKQPSEIQPSNLKGLWILSEPSGSRTDSSGNNNTLTDNNTVTAREGFRQSRTSYFNSANSEYLSIANASQTGLNINGASAKISVFTRVKFDAMASTYYFISRGGATVNGYAFSTNGSALRFYVDTTEYALTLPVALVASLWYDLAAVYDATADTVKFYINGFLAGTVGGATANITSNTSSFYIGANPTPGQYMNGLMECLGIWSAALTDAEIASMSTVTDIFCLNTGGEEHLRSSASLNVRLAQAFTVPTSGWYDSFTFLGYRNNNPTGNAFVTIETTSSNNPTGTVIATSQNVDVSLPHTSAGEINFYLPAPIYLTAGTVYAAVPQGTYSVSSTVGLRFIRSSGGAGLFTGGSARTYDGSSWSAISTDDFYFKANRVNGPLIVSHFLESGSDDRGELFSNNNIDAWGQNIKFTSIKMVKTVAVWRTTYQNPTGTVVAKIYTNNAGVPGTLLATSASFNRNLGYTTGTPSTRANGGLWIFEFANTVSLAANTEYFLVIEASAGGDGSNYNMLYNTGGNGFASTYDLQKKISGSWSTLSSNYDMQFALFDDVPAAAGGNFFAVL